MRQRLRFPGGNVKMKLHRRKSSEEADLVFLHFDLFFAVSCVQKPTGGSRCWRRQVCLAHVLVG